MPSWYDDEGRCHFEVNGVPCYQSPVGCPAHGGATSKAKRLTQGERDAYRRGAEAMREAAADLFQGNIPGLAAMPTWSALIRELPIPVPPQGEIQ